MTVIDYRPTLNGEPADLAATGGAVEVIRLYATPTRTGTLVAEGGPGSVVARGVYQVDLGEVPAGRYWPWVRWTASDTGPTYTDTPDYIDFPIREDLVVSAEEVAVEAGLTLPIDEMTREDLWTGIRDAQGAVIEAVGPILPTTETHDGLYPYGTNILDPATWFADPDRTTVLSATANADGTYRVLVRRGLNGRTEAPIRRYVKHHAAAAYRGSPSGVQRLGRVVSSVSTEGQSVSYATGIAASGGMSTVPTIEGLVKAYVHRRPKVYQRASLYPDRRADVHLWA